ncbi:MAG: hypothetical protein D4R70_00695 [Betaproteobacteria bacterium]|nr:MAG: hypothetical protein D4R70_00695 [Betaproteobacteria bacterium]
MPPSTRPLNSLRARLCFSFKGETHTLDTVIDLDRHLHATQTPNFHAILAQAGGIDPYSYLYEAIESHEIAFSEPTGMAVAYCHAEHFDGSSYAAHAARQPHDNDWAALQAIATQHLGIADLNAQADLKAALLAAYQVGQARSA